VDAAAHAGDLRAGVFTIFSWAWYIITMPGLTRWLTTARAAIAPLMLNSSIQSLSTMPALLGVVLAQPDASGRRGSA
jgi:hypothetical protein